MRGCFDRGMTMRTVRYFAAALAALALGCGTPVLAQDATGYWRGTLEQAHLRIGVKS